MKIFLKKLTSVIDSKNTLEEYTRKIAAHEEFIKGVFQNQTRLRENIKSLEKVSNSVLVERYLKDLNQEEDKLIQARQAIDNLDKQKRDGENQLKNLKMLLSSDATKVLETLE